MKHWGSGVEIKGKNTEKGTKFTLGLGRWEEQRYTEQWHCSKSYCIRPICPKQRNFQSRQSGRRSLCSYSTQQFFICWVNEMKAWGGLPIKKPKGEAGTVFQWDILRVGLYEYRHRKKSILGCVCFQDEECLRPGDATDTTFLEKLEETVKNHPHFLTWVFILLRASLLVGSKCDRAYRFNYCWVTL